MMFVYCPYTKIYGSITSDTKKFQLVFTSTQIKLGIDKSCLLIS